MESRNVKSINMPWGLIVWTCRGRLKINQAVWEPEKNDFGLRRYENVNIPVTWGVSTHRLGIVTVEIGWYSIAGRYVTDLHDGAKGALLIGIE